MTTQKSKFALFFGNRAFFPASLIAEARETLPRVLKAWGHEVIMLAEDATRYGAVETAREGQTYANFLYENKGKYDGVILCLPNFGDETGAVTALREAGVPILIQAYPDEMDKMSPTERRDSFCGKLSIADVFRQNDVKFTVLKPHVVAPDSESFKNQVDYFDRVCRTVKGMKNMIVGAIGARTTPFKTVRIDELALQHHGITVETLDLSEVIGRVRAMKTDQSSYQDKAKDLQGYTSWEGVPDRAYENIVKLAVVLDEIIDEYQMDAVGIRCWLELQKQLGISPCVTLGALNTQGIGASCEVDLGSAIAMRALHLASGEPPVCLDWNNNYYDEQDKCILFHCGPAPEELMVGQGRITDHDIIATSIGSGLAYGCNVGRLAPFEFTFGNLLTESGALKWYLGQGKFTEDQIPQEFFGVAGVAEINELQDVLLHIMRSGHRHHVNLTPGYIISPLQEALGYYLNHETSIPQRSLA